MLTVKFSFCFKLKKPVIVPASNTAQSPSSFVSVQTLFFFFFFMLLKNLQHTSTIYYVCFVV